MRGGGAKGSEIDPIEVGGGSAGNAGNASAGTGNSSGAADGDAEAGGKVQHAVESDPVNSLPPLPGSRSTGSGDSGQTSGTPGGSPGGSSGSPDAEAGGSIGGVASADDSSSGSDAPLGAQGDSQPGQPKQPRRMFGIAGPKATVGYEHEVIMRVDGDQICVDEEPPVSYARAESADRLATRVIRVLQRDARSWGRPPENFYWVPAIKVIVSPGGIVTFERIHKILLRHALISSVDYCLDSAKPQPKPDQVLE